MKADFAVSIVCGIEMVNSHPILVLGIGLREKAAVLILRQDQARDLHFNLTRLCDEIGLVGISEKQREYRRNQIFFGRKALHERTPDLVLQFPKVRIVVRGTSAIFELQDDDTGQDLIFEADDVLISELRETMGDAIPIMEGKMQTSNRSH